MEKKIKWYSLEPIKEKHCQYNMIFGERSNGKTYAVLSEILLNYRDHKKQGGLIRRYDDDIKPNKLGTIFDHIITNGDLKKIFKGKGDWTGITYRNRRFYLTKKVLKENKKYDYTTEEVVLDEKPFMWAFSLSQEEDYKENAFPDINIIFLDEFLTRNTYLNDEFILFTNLISTIKRKRQDMIIYMCGNTINQYCPYFREMGLRHVRQQKKGTIEVYQFGDTGLRVAVEYADTLTKSKKDIDPYFCFDNPKLKMITQGDWEFDIYPHAPMKWLPKDILMIYFIVFENIIYQCEIVQIEENIFTYIHLKTTPLKMKECDIIYAKDVYPSINRRTRISKPIDEVGRKIWWFYTADKVFYQDNETGEAIRNYILWSQGVSD